MFRNVKSKQIFIDYQHNKFFNRDYFNFSKDNENL